MELARGLITRLTRNGLGMDPCTSISRITAIKHMTVKIIMRLMNSLITNKSSWMKEPERNYLMLTLPICRYLKLRWAFIDLFVDCIYTRHQFRIFLFLELLLKRTWGHTFTPVFITYLCYIYRENALNKVFWRFDQFPQSYESLKISSCCKCIKQFSLHICVTLMEKEPSTKFYGVFYHFLQNYEVTKL